MPLADDIQALAAQSLSALQERHDYFTFTSNKVVRGICVSAIGKERQSQL
jgi:hypothetical protein